MVREVKSRESRLVQKRSWLSKICRMKTPTAADFLDGFCTRVRTARKARGLTQAEMAAALGVGGEAYRAYEKRTPLPHFLIERFCRIAGVEIEYLFTGRRRRTDRKIPTNTA